MPCFSTIPTKLIDLVTIQKAVKATGAKITAQSPNTLVIEKDGQHITLERTREGENWRLMTNRSSWNYDSMLGELTMSYAKTTMKAWADKNGYTFSAGSKPGEYTMTQYVGK
ncbi:MAG: hypothetical protein IPL32_18060 [Chloracidobacterium sp.]|nr:hypothetical protein [Chloracidobacterium sp.]